MTKQQNVGPCIRANLQPLDFSRPIILFLAVSLGGLSAESATIQKGGIEYVPKGTEVAITSADFETVLSDIVCHVADEINRHLQLWPLAADTEGHITVLARGGKAEEYIRRKVMQDDGASGVVCTDLHSRDVGRAFVDIEKAAASSHSTEYSTDFFADFLSKPGKCRSVTGACPSRENRSLMIGSVFGRSNPSTTYPSDVGSQVEAISKFRFWLED